jgi:hypothetical protein
VAAVGGVADLVADGVVGVAANGVVDVVANGMTGVAADGMAIATEGVASNGMDASVDVWLGSLCFLF